MAVCSHLLLGCQTLDKSVKLKPWNVADFSRTWSGLTADFFLKYYDKMGCVRSRLLKKSQRKHFAPNASLLAALVRLDERSSWLSPHSAATGPPPQGVLLGDWAPQVAPTNPTWTLLQREGSCTLQILCILKNAFFGTRVQQALHWCCGNGAESF